MSSSPIVSIVMTALNASLFIREAIESILNQTYKDFEFIIINDGSTDETENIIKSFTDPRIVYIDNGGNLGLARSFNVGVKAARGRYIARMDADDVSVADRLETQVSFLEKNPEVGIVGSSIIVLDKKGRELRKLTRPFTHMGIKWVSLFSTPMYHPTIMARTEIMKNNLYSEALSNSEDYELWSRLLFKTQVRFANISRSLLHYRIYPTSFTQTINLDKRVISAHNTLSNIRHYVDLNDNEESILIRLRQEQPLSLTELLIVLVTYFRAAFSFTLREKTGFKQTIETYSKVCTLVVFLIKHKAKHP